MNAPQPDRGSLPLALRIPACCGPVCWLLSILDALLRSRGTPDLDGFHWIFYRPATFDFYNYIDRTALLGHPAFFTLPGYPWYYPAPSIFLLLPLYRFASHFPDSTPWLSGYLLYLALALSGFAFCALQVIRGLRRRGLGLRRAILFALSVTLFSWPLYFALQRGNIEALTWLALASAIWAFARERWALTALLLGVAASFKLYPLLCFALFLPARRWRELALGLATFASLTLLALHTLSSSLALAWYGTRAGIAQWVHDYAVGYGPASATYDHSFYELLKVFTLPFQPSYPALLHRDLLAVGAAALLLFLVRVQDLSRSNQLLFLVTACAFFPPASLDYTLLNLYIPFAWLTLALASNPTQNRRPAILITFALFALALSPKLFLSFHGITQQGLATAVCLLGLLAISVLVPLPDLAAPSPPPSSRHTPAQTKSVTSLQSTLRRVRLPPNRV